MTVLRHLGCVLLGAAVAAAALLVHRSAPPLGLLLALTVSVAVPWRLLRSRRSRTAGSYVVGWLAVCGVAVIGRPEGDYLIADDLQGWSLVGAGLVLVVVGVVSFAGAGGRAT